MSVGPVLWYFDSLSRSSADPTEQEGLVQRHKGLLAALRHGPPKVAEAAFVEHIENVKAVVIARLNTHVPSRGGKHDA